MWGEERTRDRSVPRNLKGRGQRAKSTSSLHKSWALSGREEGKTWDKQKAKGVLSRPRPAVVAGTGPH